MSVLDDRSAGSPASGRHYTPLANHIIRHRRVLWIILAIVYLFAFNGQWRVGRDSALYRGLANSLASGKGYTFSAFSERQILPGYPVVLAGLQKLFGRADLAPILLMQLTALGTLIFTYKLIRLRYPQWVAIIVTFAVGMNGWFLELSEEMLADMPFLFGMMMALYGWERLRVAMTLDEGNARQSDDDAVWSDRDPPGVADRASQARRLNQSVSVSIALLVLGLVICGVMRPTRWIIAIAWVLTCVWGFIRGPRRRFFAICLGLLVVIFIAAALIDPRVRGFHPLSGGYEHDALNAARHVESKVLKNTGQMLTAELAYGFFGAKWVPGVTEIMDALAILACLVLWKRNPLWTLVVLLTIGVTMIMGAVPRYYAMLVPLMALSWIALSMEIARRFRLTQQVGDLVVLAAILTIVLPNLAWCVKVIGQQHHWGDTDDDPPWADVMAMSEKVREIVPEKEKVIAPGASIMAYLSGRDVVTTLDILPDPRKKSEVHWPEHLSALNIRYAVFPSAVYRKAQRPLRELMDKNVIVPTERVAKVGELTLWRVEIQVPPAGQDWRKRKVTTAPVSARTDASGKKRAPATQQARKHRHAAATKKQLAQHKAQVRARQARQARVENKRKREAAARAASRKRRAEHPPKPKPATKPATEPATQPVTQPVTQPAARGAELLPAPDFRAPPAPPAAPPAAPAAGVAARFQNGLTPFTAATTIHSSACFLALPVRLSTISCVPVSRPPRFAPGAKIRAANSAALAFRPLPSAAPPQTNLCRPHTCAINC